MPREAPKGKSIKTRYHCTPLNLNLPAHSIAEIYEQAQQQASTKTYNYPAQEQRIAKAQQYQKLNPTLRKAADFENLTNKERCWWGHTISTGNTPKCIIKPCNINAEDIKAIASTTINLHRTLAQAEKITKNLAYQQAGMLIDHPEAPVYTYYNESEGDDLHHWWLYNLEAVNYCYPPLTPIKACYIIRYARNPKIPTLSVKLAGPANYPEWATSIKLYFRITRANGRRVWEIIEGIYERPVKQVPVKQVKGEKEAEASKATTISTLDMEVNNWDDANDLALLTIRENCEEDVRSRIGTFELAAEAYEELRKAFEGKTATQYFALLASINNYPFDDRSTSIEDHVTGFEKRWNTFTAIINRADINSEDYFGQALRFLAKSPIAKAEFLLQTLPTFYSNTVENIRSKDSYEYIDVVQKLKDYIPMCQKGRKSKGTQEDPVVLRTEVTDNGKRCGHCISKGWKGLNHTEDECRTKKREQKKKETKATETIGSGDTEFVKMISTTANIKDNRFQFDNAATVHTTNNRSRLKNISKANINVEGLNQSITNCELIGTIDLHHNGKTITLKNVHYHPTFSNLVSGLIWEGRSLLTNSGTGTRRFYLKDELIFDFAKDSIKLMIDEDRRDSELEEVRQTDISFKEAHERYGHISLDTLLKLLEFKGATYTKTAYEACEKGKSTKPPAYKQPTSIRTTRILQRIHADLVGPFTPEGQGKRNALVIMDNYSCYITVIPIRNKSEAGKLGPPRHHNTARSTDRQTS